MGRLSNWRWWATLWVCGLVSVLALAPLEVDAADQAPRPNIILVMADDLGYSDVGCYGGEIATPHLDGLAQAGVRFTQFYNTARCCPTRASLLTGLYPHQAGIGHMVADYGVPSYQGYLNDRCLTIAEALRQGGYTTLMTGKWHVGSRPEHWPTQRGFDRYFGTPSGGGVYFRDALQIRDQVFFTLQDEKVEFPEEAYVTDLFTDYALDFVNEAASKEQPFFLYLAHIAPHWPLQAKPEDIAKYEGRYEDGWDTIRDERFAKQQQLGLATESWKLSPRDRQARPWEASNEARQADLARRMSIYAAQVDSIDQNIGRLVAKLKELDQFDNTIILFFSDNGCSAEGGPGGFSRGRPGAEIGTGLSYASAGLEWANVSDTPFRKFKMDIFEGGIASPLIVHWPSGLENTGGFFREPAHVIDLMPTCLELAGVAYPDERDGKPLIPLEGVSLLPALRGQSLARSEPLGWEHQGNRGLRHGDWKIVAPHNGEWRLFNIAEDRSETNNLAAEHPQRVAELAKLWDAWAERCGVLPWPVRRNR